MIKQVKMGEVCFELDNTVKTHEQLIEFFKSLGFILIKNESLGNEIFNRTSQFTNNDGLMFNIIWFKNLAHLRIGEWGKAFIECNFTKIIGSFIPNSGHVTLDFINVNNRTFTLSIAN